MLYIGEGGIQRRFGEDIGKLICRRKKDWHKLFLMIEMMNVIHPNINVFGLLVIQWIRSDLNITFIITK